MTNKEKKALIKRAMDHISDLSHAGVLSDDETLYLYDLFWQARWRLESCVEEKIK